jgi:hypothetical protein
LLESSGKTTFGMFLSYCDSASLLLAVVPTG